MGYEKLSKEDLDRILELDRMISRGFRDLSDEKDHIQKKFSQSLAEANLKMSERARAIKAESKKTEKEINEMRDSLISKANKTHQESLRQLRQNEKSKMNDLEQDYIVEKAAIEEGRLAAVKLAEKECQKTLDAVEFARVALLEKTKNGS